MGLGDQIAQNFIEDNSKTVNFVRTMQFTGIGLFISVSNSTKMCDIWELQVFFGVWCYPDKNTFNFPRIQHSIIIIITKIKYI